MKPRQTNRYQAIIADIFFRYHKKGLTVIPFTRVELIATAEKLDIVLPKIPAISFTRSATGIRFPKKS